MSEYDQFLSRWSRRKGQAQRAGTKVCVPDPIGGDKPTSQSLSGQARSNDRGAEPIAELHVKELALLPRIEDMTAATDLAQFLRKGVPTALRNAAMRRMWTLDPAIQRLCKRSPGIRLRLELSWSYPWRWSHSCSGFRRDGGADRRSEPTALY